MSLKANELGDAMASALPAAWKAIKGVEFPLPDVPDDSKVLFRAVALGLLTYLKAHPGDTLSAITLTLPVTGDTPCAVKNVVIDATVT